MTNSLKIQLNTFSIANCSSLLFFLISMNIIIIMSQVATIFVIGKAVEISSHTLNISIFIIFFLCKYIFHVYGLMKHVNKYITNKKSNRKKKLNEKRRIKQPKWNSSKWKIDACSCSSVECTEWNLFSGICK